MERKKFDILINFEKSDSITSDNIKVIKDDYNSIEFDFQISKTDYSRAVLFMVKPSGLHFVSDITNNKVIFNTNVAFNEAGKYIFRVALYGADSRLTNTASGELIVIDGDMDVDNEIVEQENYRILDSLINEVIIMKDDINNALKDSFKNVSYNGSTGVLTFTRRDNTTIAIDLPLELLIESGYYESSTKKLVLVLANKDTIKIPVEDLVNEYFADGTTLKLTTVNGKLTFALSDTYKSNVDSNTSNRHSHSNKSVLDGTTASFTTAFKNILDNIKSIATGGKFEDLTNKSNAGYHNSIFRGKDITSYLDDGTLYTRISNGSFEDLFVGDYIIKNGKTWRIAGFDVYLHKGDTELTKHHAVIVPDQTLQNAQMNATDTTVGGYKASAMWTTTLPSVLSTYITPIFGTHVISRRTLITNAMDSSKTNRRCTTGASSGWEWISTSCDLMSSVEVTGDSSFSSSGFDIGDRNCQFPLFRLAPEYMTYRSMWYWERDIVDSSRFAGFGAGGNGHGSGASASGGVRPCFIID